MLFLTSNDDELTQKISHFLEMNLGYEVMSISYSFFPVHAL